MADFLTTYRMKILPLTAMHIGTGEVVNPGEYFVFGQTAYFVDLGAINWTPKFRDRLLLMMNTPCWVKEIQQVNGFQQIIEKHARFAVELGDDATDITEKWGQGTTALAVALLPRAITGPYIPGSSIKGALRTALIAQAFNSANPPPINNERKIPDWERMTMGGTEVFDRSGHSRDYPIESDPLRNLRVSDATAGTTIHTEIHRVAREGMKTGGDAADLQDYRECFPGAFFIEQQYDITGSLTIGMFPGKPANPLLTREVILASCNHFYLRALKADYHYWQAKGHEIAELCEDIRKDAEEHADQSALIRLGWGSGREAMSLNQLRPEPLPTKTRALVGGYTAGWALLSLEDIH